MPSPNDIKKGTVIKIDGQLWSVAAAGGQAQRMSNFAGRPGTLGHFALATDGKSLFFSWEDDLGDLWVMDVAG